MEVGSPEFKTRFVLYAGKSILPTSDFGLLTNVFIDVLKYQKNENCDNWNRICR